LHACPSYSGGINKRITVQATPGEKPRDSIQKITKARRAEGVAQVVEPNKCKALNFNPSTEKKEKKKSCGETGKVDSFAFLN
jgi:predicted Zn-ribbon and HTH transcriptional regulator